MSFELHLSGMLSTPLSQNEDSFVTADSSFSTDGKSAQSNTHTAAQTVYQLDLKIYM